MLVLARKAGDEIVIDRDIRITVLAASSGIVRLGIVAPRSVRVLRQELCEPPTVHEPTPALTDYKDSASINDTIMAGLIRIAR